MRNSGLPGKARRSLLLVISAPSGAGKTTLCKRLMAESEGLVYSVSCTTRAPRKGEKNGKDYHFLSRADFRKRIGKGLFLEYAAVHGCYYGTLKEPVTSALTRGKDVLMDIDVQGARQIRKYLRKASGNDPIRRAFVDVFIAAPSMNELRKRLKTRNQDSHKAIERRLRTAKREMRDWPKYRYLVVNDCLDKAVEELKAIRSAEHCLVTNSARE